MLDGVRSIDEMRLESQRVLVRADLDVALDEAGAPRDDAQLRALVPTLKHAAAQDARVIVAGHRGNPGGKRAQWLSLEPVGARLAELMDCDVLLPDECVGDAARKVIADLRPGQICMLENLRFEGGEERDDESFAHRLARLCDAYVNDAFPLLRTKHASVHALPRLVPNRGMGLALRDELSAILRLREPERPLVAVIGGTRLAESLELIEVLLPVAEALCFGGAVANTLLSASGHDLKASKIEPAELAHARTLLERARDRHVEVLLPSDAVVAQRAGAPAGTTVKIGEIPEGLLVLDVGPETIARISARIASARTVLWSGPLGLFGNPAFAQGTRDMALALGQCSGTTAALGSAAAGAVRAVGVADRVSVVASANDAAFSVLFGRRLPALEALRGGWD